MAPEKQAVLKLKGKIQDSTQVGKDKDNYPIIQTIIVTPAKDTYSYPSKYCIMSKARLGEIDQELAIDAEVRCRPYRDKEGIWRYPHDLWAVI